MESKFHLKSFQLLEIVLDLPESVPLRLMYLFFKLLLKVTIYAPIFMLIKIDYKIKVISNICSYLGHV